MVTFCSMIDVDQTNAIFLRNEIIQRKFCTGTHFFKKTGVDPKNKSLIVTLDQRKGQINPKSAWSEPYLFSGESPILLGISLLFNARAHSEDLRFRFAPLFYKLADEFKSSAGLGNYNAVHFRVEDDWLDHVFAKHKANKKTFKSVIFSYLYHYVAFIVSNLDTSLPLVVAIGPNTRLLPFALSYLRLFVPTLVITPKKDVFHHHGYPEGRELYAIVDMLLISDSIKFIGHQDSTYSIEIVNNRISAGNNNSVYFGFPEKRAQILPDLVAYFDSWNYDAMMPPVIGDSDSDLYFGKPRGFADFRYERIKPLLSWNNRSTMSERNSDNLYKTYS